MHNGALRDIKKTSNVAPGHGLYLAAELKIGCGRLWGGGGGGMFTIINYLVPHSDIPIGYTHSLIYHRTGYNTQITGSRHSYWIHTFPSISQDRIQHTDNRQQTFLLDTHIPLYITGQDTTHR